MSSLFQPHFRTQHEDGGWPVDITRISKGDRSAPAKAKSLKDSTMIYSYWGTAWSTLSLLQAVPMLENAGKKKGQSI